MDTTRIGPRMADVARLADGQRMAEIAAKIAPHGKGLRFGYAAIHRAVAAGLVYLVPDPTRRGAYLVCPVLAE